MGRRLQFSGAKCPARDYYRPGMDTPEIYNWGLWTTEIAQLRVAGGKRSKKTTKQYNCPTRVEGKTTTLAMRRDHFAALWGGRAWKAHTLAKLRGKTVCLSCCQVNTDGFFEANACTGWSHW